MLTSYFCVCKLWGLPLKTDIWRNVETHQLVIVLTELKNMLIHHAIFYCELFSLFSSWLSARSSTLLMLAGVRALCHCMDDHLPDQLNGLITAGHVNILFYQLSVHGLETSCINLLLHNPCWLANILSKLCLYIYR